MSRTRHQMFSPSLSTRCVIRSVRLSALPEAAMTAVAKWGAWCIQQTHKSPLTTLHAVRILHLYLNCPSSAAFLMWWSGWPRSWNHSFYAPQSEYIEIFVIYFTYYIYIDAACEHLKCKTVIFVFSTAGSKKWGMRHTLSNPGSHSPPSEPLLCADEVVSNA